jgi:PIF1-like helicase
MPNFIGEWFPRNDVPELQEYYHASMLALLTPWTNIGQLKRNDQTFQEAFESFVSTADMHTLNIIDNIQYHYKCADSALRKKQERAQDTSFYVHDAEEDENGHGVNRNESSESFQDMHFDQQDVKNALAAQYSHEEKLFVDIALNIAIDHGIFTEDIPSPTDMILSACATEEDMIRFQELESMVKAVTKDRLQSDNRANISPEIVNESFGLTSGENVQPMEDIRTNSKHTDILNEEQLRAHDIITNNLHVHLDGKRPKQILMMLMGQGSTGKSTVLNAITTTFDKLDVPHLLGKMALSGVAASLVGGTTLHWYAGLPPFTTPQSDIWPDNPSKKIREHRTKNLQSIEWLAIDEMGMCTLNLLTLLSQVATKVHVDDRKADVTIPFGGLNIILLGDFHQFPPVGAPNAALYCPPVARNTATVGKAIYSQFETVIDLVQQWRIEDKEWMNILQRSREGECTKDNIREIRKLILTNPNCKVLNFTSEPWNQATLITPRNCVQANWNKLALRKHCQESNNVLYVCDTEDMVGNERKPTTVDQKVIIAGMKLERTGKIAQRIEFAIGMQVMVML